MSDTRLSEVPAEDHRLPDPAPVPRRRERMLRAVARGLGTGVAAMLVAALAVGLLELVQARHDPWWSWQDRLLALPREVLLLDVLVATVLVLFLLAVTGRLWLATTLVLAGAGVVAFANDQKLRLRTEPVYPSDVYFLGEPGFLLENVGPGPTAWFAAGTVAVLLAGYGVHRLVARAGRGRRAAEPLIPERRRWLLRAVAALATGAVLVSVVRFHAPDNPVRRAYEAAVTFWAPWDQRENYAHNGFVAGLLYNMPAPAMDVPEGYDAATMRDLARRYRELAARTNTDRDPQALAGTNVVIVLAESFTDPTEVRGARLDSDPIPFTRELMASTTSGRMVTPAFGGGTANVEFEALTGMAMRNLRPQMTTPYQMLLPRHREFPSHLSSLADGSHRTVALHPFLPSYYQRETVYETLGFEHVEFADDMTHRYRLENDRFVSDSATFRELVDELRDTERPVLANVVTMQNHGPARGKYDDPIQAWGPSDESMSEELEQYLRGLRYSDQALEQLVEDLDRLDERTIVLVYGDHLPSGWPDSLLYQDPLTRYVTPYLVHANFDTEPVETPPLLGPTFLVNQLLATADAPVSGYQALLDEVARELPVYEPTAMLDAEGNPVAEEDLSEEQRRLLHDYRLAQYDLSVGRRHVAEELLEVVPAG
ncbi:MAG TPA: sulfatase-like hydrolase/transferase [Nocardioidaceae bacterium]